MDGMSNKATSLAMTAAVMVLTAPAVQARPLHPRIVHHHATLPREGAAPYAVEPNPYQGYEGPGSIVLNATERAKHEPGVTNELAPDAKETATGGPVGGVPGFDGT
jgi:hypothetical protein